MQNNIIECYTDASYSKEVGSVIAYKIGNNDIITERLQKILKQNYMLSINV